MSILWNIKSIEQYLDWAIFKEKTDRTSFDDESVANNLANDSNVDPSDGASKHR